MNPRQGLFQRKGGPSASGSPAMTIAIHSGDAPRTSNSDSTGPGDQGETQGSETDNEGQVVTCPQCGCEFDPDAPDMGQGQPAPTDDAPPMPPMGDAAS